jgi:large subunit ribosomal protein L13
MTKIFQTKDCDRKWYLLDAQGVILGRLSTVAAEILRGKNKATYTPNMDGGDNVVIVNADKVILSTENKTENKSYYRHSGYPGGIKKETFAEAQEKHPERVIMLSVAGMLPSNKLAKDQLKRLRVYAGKDHKHTQELIPVLLDKKGQIKKENA